MARLRWRAFFGSMWSDEVGQIVHTPMPAHLKGQDRVTFAKSKTSAAELMKTLFPPDEEPDG